MCNETSTGFAGLMQCRIFRVMVCLIGRELLPELDNSVNYKNFIKSGLLDANTLVNHKQQWHLR